MMEFRNLHALLVSCVFMVKGNWTTGTTTASNEVCSSNAALKADIFVLLDGSSSIGAYEFEKELRFLDRLISNLSIGPDQSQLGVLQFSGQYHMEFNLNSYKSGDEIRNALKNVKYPSGITLAGQAIRHVAEASYSSSLGARSGVRKLMLVITDGLSQDDLREPSKLANQRGIDVISIGVTPKTNRERLLEVANGEAQNTFSLDESSSLEETVSGVKRRLQQIASCYKINEHEMENSLETPLLESNSRKTTYSTNAAKMIETGSKITLDIEKLFSLICGHHEMTVSLNSDNNRLLHRFVFVKDHYMETGCQWDISSIASSNRSITLKYDQCGVQLVRTTQPTGLNVSVTLFWMQRYDLITSGDFAYKFVCFYPESDQTTSLDLNILDDSRNNLTMDAPLPKCTHSLELEGRNDSLNNKVLLLGQNVIHRWSCFYDSQARSPYGMKIHSCYFKNAAGTRKEMVIDERGCSNDESVISNPKYNDDLTSAYSRSQVVKYADSDDISLECEVSLCAKLNGATGCVGKTPPDCKQRPKKKRSLISQKYSEQQKSNSFDICSGSNFVLDALDRQGPSLLSNFHEKLTAEPNEYLMCVSPVLAGFILIMAFTPLILLGGFKLVRLIT